MPPYSVPSPRQAGQILGRSIENMPLGEFLRPHAQELFAVAQVTKDALHGHYLGLMVAAALHAIESSRLSPEDEFEVAGGLYDWAKSQSNEHLRVLLPTIEDATDAFASAAAKDAASQQSSAGFSEVEIEFAEQLLGPDDASEVRVQACLGLSAVLPKHLWQAQFSGALETLRQAGLLQSDA